MAKIMKRITVICLIMTVITMYLYQKLNIHFMLVLAVTSGTTLYHFAMRLAVGYVIDYVMDNHADYHKKWYQPISFEKKLYKILKVKQWKDKMPTYQVGTFSVKDKTFDEIAQAMCQAEIVHEIIIVLSFVPILASYKFGSLEVFIITSFMAAGFDSLFVMMQRYNRPRIVKLAEREKKRKEAAYGRE